MHACMHGWMDACMHVCMYVCIYIYVRICKHVSHKNLTETFFLCFMLGLGPIFFGPMRLVKSGRDQQKPVLISLRRGTR